MADAIALIDDLFFLAKVRETAKQAGVALETATTGEQLIKASEASPSALILVDLNARQGALQAVERLCAPAPAGNPGSAGGSAVPAPAGRPGNPRRVIAFLSHVQTDLAERARAAGCQTSCHARSSRKLSRKFFAGRNCERHQERVARATSNPLPSTNGTGFNTLFNCHSEERSDEESLYSS